MERGFEIGLPAFAAGRMAIGCGTLVIMLNNCSKVPMGDESGSNNGNNNNPDQMNDVAVDDRDSQDGRINRWVAGHLVYKRVFQIMMLPH